MDLGKFEVIEEVGKGGFGIVYKALDKVLDRQVALKILHPQLLINPLSIQRFKHEAQLSARLDHPNILPVYEFREFEGRFCIVMAYMPDGSLKDLLKNEGRLDKQRSLKIFEQICDGMSYAHKRKIVHRDLKPANILFDEDGNARISDMGFAKLLHSDSSASLSASGGLVGTPSYMAPEIWQGNQASSASDVYSLACVLVEMLTGQPLFGGDSTPAIMLKHFAPLSLPEDLPVEWKPVLEAALEMQPEERILTVEEFIGQIKAVEGKINPTERSKTELKESSEASDESEISSSLRKGEKPEGELGKKRTKRMVWIGVIAVLLLLVVFLVSRNINRSSATIEDVKVAVPATATSTAVIPTEEEAPRTVVLPTETATASPVFSETPAATTTESALGIGSIRLREIDEMEQVYVPEGDFIMGTDDDPEAYGNEKPVRKIYLDAFWIDKYEVSKKQYKMCVDAKACDLPGENFRTYDNYPVTNVNWDNAKVYCAWAGGSLPTEAQWEKAARGDDARKYPWGNQEPDSSYANYYENIGATIEVGRYEKGASPYGALNMAGNVWEWVNDLYSDFYDEREYENPQGPNHGDTRGLRGGSLDNPSKNIRTTNRNKGFPYVRSITIGFRCVSTP